MFTCGHAGPPLLPGLPLVAVGGGSSSVAACRLLVAVASCVAEHGLEAHGLQKPWLLGSRVLAQSLWCPPISGRQLCCAAEKPPTGPLAARVVSHLGSQREAGGHCEDNSPDPIMLPDPSRERVFYTMTKFNICTCCSERGFGSDAFP